MNKQIIKNWMKRILYGYGIKRFFDFTYYPHVSEKASTGYNNVIGNPNNIIMEGNSTLKRDSVIMNGRARFTIKTNSGSRRIDGYNRKPYECRWKEFKGCY